VLAVDSWLPFRLNVSQLDEVTVTRDGQPSRLGDQPAGRSKIEIRGVASTR
jgi:hypothetical protein